jgi:hypothetical protein
MQKLDDRGFQQLKSEVRDGLRKSLSPAAQAQLEAGAFDPELRKLTAATASLSWVLAHRDGSAGWAAALIWSATAYHDTLAAVTEAAASVTTEQLTRGRF